VAERISTTSRAIDRALAMVHSDPRGWTTASVFTREGIVAVYMEAGERPFTRLDFIHGDRMHTRDIHGKAYTERGLVTVAHRFAREVVYG
jgi:hypothetical protein